MEGQISFGTDGWRATLDVFTEERVAMVGQAVADYLADHGLTTGPVGIAHDPRESSPRFANTLAAVLNDNGLNVQRGTRDLPTPVLAWTIVNRQLAGGLMVTASHNPPSYNGVKFITPAGAPALPPVTDALERRLATPESHPAGTATDVSTMEPIAAYIQDVLDRFGEPDLDGLEVVYDAMHGAGRGVTDRLLDTAGARVTRYRCTRDPTFGGEGPKPAPETLGTVVNEVTDGGAALGIANDGDADRVAIITPERGFLDENLLFGAVYDYLLEDASGPAVRTVSTSTIVDRVAEANGEKVVETPVGFKWVAAAMREHDALIGGEESGGFSVRGHVREKDGILMALLAAHMETAEPIDRRIDRLVDAHGHIMQDKASVDCPDDRKADVLAAVGDAFPERLAGTPVASVTDVDGYKATLQDGAWLLVRPSGTEPKLRVYAEAGDPDDVEALLAEGRQLVAGLV